MGRSGWKTTASIRTNKAKGNGAKGTGVSFHKYDIGQRQRVVIPMFKFEDGSTGPLIIKEPVHNVIKRGAIKIKKADGGEMLATNIRCTHPYHQVDDAARQKAIDSQEYCVFDEFIELQKARKYAIIDERYGSYDDFKVLSKEERTAFWKEMEADEIIKECYSKKADGTKHYNMTIQILLYQFETETVTEKTARGINKTTTKVLLDEEGNPKFSPVLFNLSPQRQKKFEDAANTAYEKGFITDEMIHPLTEGEDDENPSLIGWVDFELNFPEADTKMESGKNLSITATDSATSVVTDAFVNLYEETEKGAEIYKKAEESFYNANISLRFMTKAEQIASFADGGALYRELLEKYGNEKLDEYHAKALSGNRFDSSEAVETKTEVETVSAKTVTASKKTVVEAETVVESDIDLDDDLLDLDGDDLDFIDESDLPF